MLQIAGNKPLNDVKAKLASGEGTATDKLRLGVLYLLVADKLPGASDTDAMAASLREAGADVAAFQYVLRMKQMNLTGDSKGSGAGARLLLHAISWSEVCRIRSCVAVNEPRTLAVPCLRLPVSVAAM